jgi:hypothetical protein
MVRGGRMFEEHFVCTLDLLSSVPSIDNEGLNLKEEIDRFNQEVVSFSRCRVVRGGKRLEAPALGTRGKGPVRYCGHSSAPKARSRNARSTSASGHPFWSCRKGGGKWWRGSEGMVVGIRQRGQA